MAENKPSLKNIWRKILEGPKILDDSEAKESQARIQAMRKERGFR